MRQRLANLLMARSRGVNLFAMPSDANREARNVTECWRRARSLYTGERLCLLYNLIVSFRFQPRAGGVRGIGRQPGR